MQIIRPSASENEQFSSVHASKQVKFDSQNGDFPIITSREIETFQPSKTNWT